MNRSTKSSRSPGKPARWEMLLDSAPRKIRRAYELWFAAIAALDAAPRNEKKRTARVWARRLGVRSQSLWTRRSEFRRVGNIALLDKRFSATAWRARRDGLPALAIEHLRRIGQDTSLTSQAVIKCFVGQLQRWREGDASAKIPGYAVPPPGNPPPGWSTRHLARCLGPRPRPKAARVAFEISIQFHADGTATWKKWKGNP